MMHARTHIWCRIVAQVAEGGRVWINLTWICRTSILCRDIVRARGISRGC